MSNVLNLENILLEEYKFNAIYAMQSLKERQTMLTLCVALFAAFVSALPFLWGLIENKLNYFAFILLAIGFLWITIFWRFSYLDSQYRLSLERMNKVRKKYREEFKIDLKTSREMGIDDDFGMPRFTVKFFPVIYPLFPGTMWILVLAVVFIGFSIGILSYYYVIDYIISFINKPCLDCFLENYYKNSKLACSFAISFVIGIGIYVAQYFGYKRKGFYYRIQALKEKEDLGASVQKKS